MERLRVQQFLPTLGYRDAIGNHTVRLRAALAELGVGGEIWPQIIPPEMDAYAAGPYPDYAERRARPGRDVLLYQASASSEELKGFLLDRPEPKLLWYHNVTPARFFYPFDADAAFALARAREELGVLVHEVDGAVADSEFNAIELRELGVPDVRVAPPFLPPDLDTPPHPGLADWLRRTRRGIDLLFVGRIVPNKGYVHLLKLLATLRSEIDPHARLFCVGSWGPAAYMEYLYAVRDRLGLQGVAFPGSVSPDRLAAHYREADLLVCLSEHEGFGLPLIEGMRAGLPVIGYDAGAVGGTLGGTGVLVRTLDPVVLAEVVGRVAGDAALREELVARQRDRVVEIEKAPRGEVLLDVVRRVLDR